ncbi:pyridoxal-dependent decarboxylase, exosortase A system-associated [Thalassotalea euphylliae]|uniref:Pyridoxal-dependent decarboxylase, exosortase A system-associated n=1 Tax=Thalassotalea euphylliae TaxID=1655234 RepID=A0A3E0U413_9GAMM|nr:pyridoxal-dependent decarboxylase, exosortase A system-associated [Thalassotalea euphylliae]REL31480.1 pyridoxal-dependent decarboxylase, exosortase A system-associated [Thalassotalea euphylliae]
MKAHDTLTPFEQEQHQLKIGNKTLSQIEMLVGSTPYYAYDRAILSKTVSSLKEALPERISLHYAIKANPYPPLVNFMRPLVSGFDVASAKEMLLAIQSGMSPNEISFAGPGKTEDDIRAAIVAGITLHAESTTEIQRAVDIGKQLSIKPNIAIRINPAFELKASGMKMAGGAKPFGIDEEQIPSILAELDYQMLNFRGFHIYAGSQNLKIEAIIEMHQKTFALAERLISITPVQIDYINIGGGLGIPYFAGETRLNLAPVADNLATLIAQHSSLCDIELIMELGRYLVGEAGVYVSKVVDIKASRETTYAVCDGGLHHHLANSGNFGQVIRKNYPVAVGNKMDLQNADTETVTVVGPLCTPLDIIADKVQLPALEIGDYIAVYQSGAYGASASPQSFLSQPELSEILL